MIAPTNYKELISLVGSFKFSENIDKKTNKPDGSVTILGDWVRQNIVLIELPILKPNSTKFFRMQCHKKIKENILEIFQEYKDNSYDSKYKIRMLGSFMPRHRLWNPKKSLSIHSYGLALDINWDTNPVGKKGDMPNFVVELFKKHGWTWGGDWKNPKDFMHMQFYTE